MRLESSTRAALTQLERHERTERRHRERGIRTDVPPMAPPGRHRGMSHHERGTGGGGSSATYNGRAQRTVSWEAPAGWMGASSVVRAPPQRGMRDPSGRATRLPPVCSAARGSASGAIWTAAAAAAGCDAAGPDSKVFSRDS